MQGVLLGLMASVTVAVVPTSKTHTSFIATGIGPEPTKLTEKFQFTEYTYDEYIKVAQKQRASTRGPDSPVLNFVQADAPPLSNLTNGTATMHGEHQQPGKAWEKASNWTDSTSSGQPTVRTLSGMNGEQPLQQQPTQPLDTNPEKQQPEPGSPLRTIGAEDGAVRNPDGTVRVPGPGSGGVTTPQYGPAGAGAPGFAPPASRPKDTVVVAHFAEKLEWLPQLSSGWRVIVVSSAERPAEVLLGNKAATANQPSIGDVITADSITQVPNVGNEAIKYLAFILKEYENLPENVIFVHGHDGSWHDPSLPKSTYINDFNREVLMQQGLVYFLSNQPLFVNAHHVVPPNPPLANNKDAVTASQFIAHIWAPVLEPYLGPLRSTEAWDTPCCAQFAVRSDRIAHRPKAMYATLYNWVLSGEMDSWQAGWTLEFLWARIFDGSPVAPPVAAKSK